MKLSLTSRRDNFQYASAKLRLTIYERNDFFDLWCHLIDLQVPADFRAMKLFDASDTSKSNKVTSEHVAILCNRIETCVIINLKRRRILKVSVVKSVGSRIRDAEREAPRPRLKCKNFCFTLYVIVAHRPPQLENPLPKLPLKAGMFYIWLLHRNS